ncbi:FTR1 family protein [Pseudorhodobacter sp.]|uniref:FTR1 family iron permease n=1 Tax=Pseudorhodobacter sp. TaxID=1934400 RepID=UPI002649B664|nr:FTR1 family protein [Pseudorhodobacter sp.]MDN5787108.1 FTR1 family protein [Pseudorhodobacter sp.]
MLAQILFIVWRESVEALLVIGILAAWMAANDAAARGRRYLWGGVLAGIAAAFALAAILMIFAAELSDEAQDWFQTGLVLLAGVLIVQMVFWMQAHGRSLKRDLQSGLAEAARRRHWWGIFTLALIAVAREGSETVVFLYGILSGGAEAAGGLPAVIGAILAGFTLALATYGLLQMGRRWLSWRLFFRITEILLLLLACQMFTSGAEKLIGLGILPFDDPLWNTGWFLSDSGRWGGLLAGLTGYRAQPGAVTVTVWVLYWAVVVGFGSWQSRHIRARVA